MRTKKLISTILALFLALQWILPALALEETTQAEAGEPTGETDILPEDPAPEEPEAAEEVPDTFEAAPAEEIPAEEPEVPVIDVLVPATGQMVINPYRMAVDTVSGKTTEQIVHEPQVLISGSDFPVRVSARAVGRLNPESTARFISTPPSVDAEDKEIFLYVEFQNDPTFWTGTYGDWPNQLLVTDRGAEKADVMALEAYGVGYFRLFGAMTNFPDPMWGEEDAPDVTLAFTFSAWEADVLPAEEEPEPAEEEVSEDEAGPSADLNEDLAQDPDPAGDPAGEPVEAPAETDPSDSLIEEPAQGPAEETTEYPAEEPAETPPEDTPEDMEEDNG